MKAIQLKDLVIQPALEKVELYSPEAVTLILGTACVESQCGEFLRQYPNGPALGIFQIEPATYEDLMKNYLDFRPELKAKVMALYCEGLDAGQNLTCNLMFQAAVCRLIYLRVSEKIPNNLAGMANYWKKYYNTSKGKGTPEKFITAFRQYVKN